MNVERHDPASLPQMATPTTSTTLALPGDIFRPEELLQDRLEPIHFPTMARRQDSSPPITNDDDASIAPKGREAYEQWMREQFRGMFRQPELSLADLMPYRVRTAWRLVREMARARGAIESDQMLLDLDEQTGRGQAMPPEMDASTTLMYDPWTIPDNLCTVAPKSKTQKSPAEGSDSYMYVRIYHLIKGAEQSLEGKDEYRPYRWVMNASKQSWESLHYNGLPLLPPPLPLPWIEPTRPDQAKEGYDPENKQHDPALFAYITILKGIASAFYMDTGTENDQNAGRYGLAGLLDPWTIRLAFPSKWQIMAFEGMIVEETLSLIVQGGKTAAREKLKNLYGLQPVEINQMIRIAGAKAIELTRADVDEDRSLMIMRLEEAARKAHIATDIRAEISAFKAIAVIQGLARVEPDNVMSDFISVVRQASAMPREIVADSTAKSRLLDG